MKRVKKGSLELSVNSIVIFVIAFAMLGVGITFVNVLKEKIIGGVTDVIPNEKLKTPADSTNRLTVPGDVDVKRNKETKMEIGFYNKHNFEATMVKIGISSCTSVEDGNPTTDIPKVISTCKDTISGGDSVGFPIVISKTAWDVGTYICNMVAFKGGDSSCNANSEPDSSVTASDTEGFIYESKEFYLNVAS